MTSRNKLLLVSLICSIFSSLCSKSVGDGDCSPEQRSSLLRVKQAFSFTKAGNSLDSWIPGSNCCDWYEVICHDDSRRSVTLALFEYGISGELPEDFFTLIENVTELDLSQNPGLSGALPDFPKSSALQSLDLSETNLRGTIPDSIGNLKYLTSLKISNCQMTGEIPSSIGNLAQLETLDLSWNGFMGAIPDSLENLHHLASMDLSSNRLSGPIPTSTRNLTKLAVMDLKNNRLSGTIPGSLFRLPALVILDLSRNQLVGQLGEHLNPSASLTQIDLSNNRLQGQIPRALFKLPSLRVLRLASNNFIGTLQLDKVGSLKSLTELSLSHNRLSVQEPKENHFRMPPFFSVLEVGSCNLTRVPPFLRYQTQLERLDLSHNTISGSMPKWMRNMDSLQYLNLSFNHLTHMEGPIFPTNLRSLDLNSNMLQGRIPLPPWCVGYVDYSNNNFSSFIPTDIFSPTPGIVRPCPVNGRWMTPPENSPKTPDIFFLSMANNGLTGEIPPSICNAKSLTVLDLSGNSLSGPIPRCLFESTMSLVVLKLRGNQLGETIPLQINEGCSLKAMILSGNHLKGPLPRSLINCSELEVLDLGNNHLVEPFPLWLGNLANLSVLVLRGNGFYGKIESPDGECTFSKLHIFDLSSNHFSGNLPVNCPIYLKSMMTSSKMTSRKGRSLEQFHRGRPFKHQPYSSIYDVKSYNYEFVLSVTSKGNEFTLARILIISYTFLDFSDNGFEGDIPEAIGLLQELHTLNFSRNALTGKIPPAIGDMKQLELLDLSANRLSGGIPPELTSLTFLSHLNLSDNNLTGIIPLGGQFSTFSNASFGGNQGLCGIPLSERCRNEAYPWIQPSNSEGSSPTYAIVLGLSIGLGYGVGIAVAVVLVNVPRKFWILWK